MENLEVLKQLDQPTEWVSLVAVEKKAEETEKPDGVHVIIDDILVTGETREEHDGNLIATLQACREKKLKLNHNKVEIEVEEVLCILVISHCKGPGTRSK